MSRFVKADQFLGAMFSNLVYNGKYEISMNEISKLEKEIYPILLQECNAVLYASTHAVYSAIDDYCDFFQIEKDNVSLNKELIFNFSKNSRSNNKKIVEKLNNYFVMGIPSDINNSFSKQFKSSLTLINQQNGSL